VRFSVIIPTCHRNADLARCLERLAPGAQTLPAADYEVIVSDDGRASTAEAMVREQFRWARWVQGPRRGPAANRNCGARHAAGGWLVFTDDDCLPDAGWLAAYSASATGDATVLEGKTNACGPRPRLDMEAPVNELGGCLWSCNFAVRADVFHDVDGFDEQFPGAAMEDMDLHERLKKAGHPVRFVPAALVRHPWRLRRGTDYSRLHIASVARYVGKHPAVRGHFGCAVQWRGLARRTVFGAVQALRDFGGRGFLRQLALDLHWQWCLRRALRRNQSEQK
jgi:GT2 family glycosyltransferase